MFNTIPILDAILDMRDFGLIPPPDRKVVNGDGSIDYGKYAQKIRDRIRELYSSAEDAEEEDDASPDSTYVVETKTAFPKISRVVFNDPVTKVWFDDGTTSSVRVSKDDTFSKEAGLAFAIVKRLYGTPDDRGNYGSGGYMMELKRVIERAYDQTPLTRKMREERAAKRASREKAEKEAPKKSARKGTAPRKNSRKRNS